MVLQLGRTVGRGSRGVLSVSGIALLTLLSKVVSLGSVNTVLREQFPVDVQEEVAFGVCSPSLRPLLPFSPPPPSCSAARCTSSVPARSAVTNLS